MKRNNQNGSALVWAISVVTIIMLIIAGSLTIAFASTKRSLNKQYSEQARFGCKSAIESEVSIILDDNNFDNLETVLPKKDSGAKVNVTVTLPASTSVKQKDLGTVKTAFVKDVTKAKEAGSTEESIREIAVVVSVEYSGKEYTMTAHMNCQNDKWYLAGYEKGDKS